MSSQGESSRCTDCCGDRCHTAMFDHTFRTCCRPLPQTSFTSCRLDVRKSLFDRGPVGERFDDLGRMPMSRVQRRKKTGGFKLAPFRTLRQTPTDSESQLDAYLVDK